MARLSPVPSVPDLEAAPELAVLTVLLGVLDMVERALLAAYPEFADQERPYWIKTPDAFRLASALLRHADGLRRAVHRYRLAVTPSSPTRGSASGERHARF